MNPPMKSPMNSPRPFHRRMLPSKLSAVTALAALTLAAFSAAAPAQKSGASASPVNVAPVEQKEIDEGHDFVGTVEPLQRAVIGSAVDGRVVYFPLKEGDRVAKTKPGEEPADGGILARLLTETIRLELATAQAELELREAERDELKTTRPQEIQQADALVAAAKAARDYAESSFQRIQRLYERGSATPDEFQSARSTLDGAEATLAEREAALRILEGGEQSKYAQAEAMVRMQQAVVEKLADQKTKHTIVSRFDGYVIAEHTEVGAWVKQGDPVAEVVALDKVDVVAQVLESYVPHVRKGEEVRVEVPALPDAIFVGEVIQVVPQADLRARTFPVKVRVENQFDADDVPQLKAGMIARVHLPVGPKRRALLVEKDAVVLGGRTPMVYVVDGADKVGETGKVRPVPVQLGVAHGTQIQVIGELKPNEPVVIRGNERLRPGQEVRIAPRVPRADESVQNE